MIRDRELVEKWHTQVLEPARAEVEALLARFPDRRVLSIPFERCGADYRFARPLLRDPDRTLAAGRRALGEFVDAEYDADVGDDDRIYLRVSDLPESARCALGAVGADHLNRLLVVEGTVVETAECRPRLVTAAFRCERCGEVETVVQRTRRLRRPGGCSSCSRGRLALSPRRSEYVDAREVRLRDGERTLPVHLEHDLVDAVAVGDEVDLVAIPRARPDDGTTAVDLELEGISVERATS